MANKRKVVNEDLALPMRYVYLAVYQALGISRNPEDGDMLLFEGSDPSTIVLITSDIDKHLVVLDRQVALAKMMLRGLLGEKKAGDFDARLVSGLEGIRQSRAKTLENQGFLVIRMEGEVQASIPAKNRVFDNFIMCLDAYDKQELRTKLHARIAAILAAVRMEGDGEYRFELISDGSYLLDPNDFVVHSYSLKMGNPSLYVSSPLSKVVATNISDLVPALLREADLARVVALFADSLDSKSDRFKAFVAAWCAIEIMINKIFKIYERRLRAQVKGVNKGPGLDEFVNRVSDVKKDKYTLQDKFKLIAAYLDDDAKSEDIQAFKDIKSIRDKIFHGTMVPDNALPVEALQRLFAEYFRNHLKAGRPT